MTIKLTTPAAVAASLAALLASAPANAAEYVQAPGSTLACSAVSKAAVSSPSPASTAMASPKTLWLVGRPRR